MLRHQRSQQLSQRNIQVQAQLHREAGIPLSPWSDQLTLSRHDMPVLFIFRHLSHDFQQVSAFRLRPKPCLKPARPRLALEHETCKAWHNISMERRAHACTGWMIIPNAEETLPPNSDCTQIEFYFDYLRFSKVTWTGSEKAPIAIAGSRMLLQTSSWLQQAHTHQMKYWVVLCFEPDGIFQSCECLAPWTRQWTQVNVSQMGGSTWQFGARFW